MKFQTIFDFIIFPILCIGLIVGVLYYTNIHLSCWEDESFCFPYNNFPLWAKIVPPIIILGVLILLIGLTRMITMEKK